MSLASAAIGHIEASHLASHLALPRCRPDATLRGWMRKVRRSPRIAHRTIEGEAAVVTIDDRKLHLLNPVGTFIFNALSEPATPDELSQRVQNEFEVAPAQALADCERFCADLVQRKILEWTE